MAGKITNTSLMAGDRLEPTLISMLCGKGVNASIEAQEAQGQQELIGSDQIPVDLVGCSEAQLEALGFTLGAATPGDGLFRFARLPQGWTKRATEHAMWSEIVDGKGVARFVIFYKAAFYDRCAFMRPAD